MSKEYTIVVESSTSDAGNYTEQETWVNEQWKIYCSIFTFEEDDPNEEKMVDLESYGRKKNVTDMRS